MSPFDSRTDLATRLDRLVPAEPAVGDWGDVLRRARPRPRLLRFNVVVAVVVFLLLAAIAASAYYSVAGHSRSTGVVTFVGGARGPAHIDAVLANGKISSSGEPGHRLRSVSSVGWSRDGRRLAFTLDESGGQSAYVGLHILDLKTGHDLHLPSPRPHSSDDAAGVGLAATAGAHGPPAGLRESDERGLVARRGTDWRTTVSPARGAG